MSDAAAIRPAREGDLAAISALLHETWHHAYDAVLGAARVAELGAEWHRPERLRRELARDGALLLVAERGGTILGVISATLDAEATMTVGRLYVRPALQRRGIGAQLLASAAGGFDGAPARTYLKALQGNAAAQLFYERQGFCAIGPLTEGAAGPGITFARWSGFRPARGEDVQDLFGLLALCFAEYPGCYVDPHEDLTDLRDPSRSFVEKGGLFLVAEDGRGRITASVAVDFPKQGEAELHRLYVRPDQRRRGLGTRLLREAEIFARHFGAERMHFWSDTRFADAHRLYARSGYARGEATRDLGDISRSVEYFFARAF